MAVFTRVKIWVSNEVLTASDLNGEFNNLLNNTIPASIEDYSADVATMQSATDPGGVGSESLATTLAGELQRIRFAIKRIAGGAQWYTAPVVTLGSTISTADIEDGAVTQAKRASLGQQLSSSSGTFSTSSTSYTDVTNLSVSITTTGRTVHIALVHDGTANVGEIQHTGGASSNSICSYKIIQDSTDVVESRIGCAHSSGSLSITNYYPAGVINHEYTPAAGTYVYKIQTKVNGGTVNFSYMKLLVYEL